MSRRWEDEGKPPRWARWVQRHRWITAIAFVSVLGIGFTVVDPPGVEKVADPLDADAAVAAGGKLYKYRCSLGYPFRKGYVNGTFQPTRELARQSAIRKASGGYKPVPQNDVRGSYTLLDRKGREAFTDVNVKCSLTETKQAKRTR